MGFHFNLDSLSTDKNYYYIYEYLEINAKWELYYDIENDEVSFIQIQIYNSSNDLIWNSSEISNMGFHNESWDIYIPDLALNLSRDSTQLYIKFYHFFDNGVQMISTFRQTINITILKSELSCELIGFKDSMIFGEAMNFVVKFFETGNNSVLINQLVFLNLKYNYTMIFSREFITNDIGEINLNLSSLYDLKIGRNELNFIINDSIIYNPIQFSYTIKVNRIPIIVNITQCEKDESISEVNLELRYYYYFNGKAVSLPNSSICIKILQNNSLKKDFLIRTDLNGNLLTKILYKSLDLDRRLSEFWIRFIFNGTKYLENRTTNLLIKLDGSVHTEKLDSIQIIYLSGFISSIMIFSVLIIHKKRNKEKSLADLYIKA